MIVLGGTIKRFGSWVGKRTVLGGTIKRFGSWVGKRTVLGGTMKITSCHTLCTLRLNH